MWLQNLLFSRNEEYLSYFVSKNPNGACCVHGVRRVGNTHSLGFYQCYLLGFWGWVEVGGGLQASICELDACPTWLAKASRGDSNSVWWTLSTDNLVDYRLALVLHL